ncbi:Protein H06I04.6 b [Aphelenchoides avenae]|nr:Protein H06I04.6 b [Aphelenchus avenae]
MVNPLLTKTLWTLVVVCLLADQVGCKRGGGGIGRGGFGSRGSSAARSSSASRGSSSSRGGSGGIFGGSSSRGSSSGSGGYAKTGGGYAGGTGAGLGRSNTGFQTSSFSKGSGLGSRSRSSTFKNVIVGAAAGYLTYQAGKHLIRSAMAPMMWNNRQYYWGSNYYRGQPGQNMCRMPLDSSNPEFGDIYFQDNTRPREVVWGCGYNEHCCGYECCPGGGGYSGYGGSRYGFGLGSLIVLILLCCCGFFVIRQILRTRSARSGNYQQPNASYRTSEPPPQYPGAYPQQPTAPSGYPHAYPQTYPGPVYG